VAVSARSRRSMEFHASYDFIALVRLFGLRQRADALTDTRSVMIMYGPPRDCKGEFGREDKSAAMYSAFDGAACSWPG
jgi:hypothetical protein